MKTITKTLREFGLSPNEIDVYLACINEVDLSPFKISKITGIPRTTVYDVLLSLSLKKLVTLEQSDGFTKQQTRVTAANPSILRKLIREKKEKLDELEIDIIDILPELKTHFSKRETDSDFRFYGGIEGFKRIYFDTNVMPEIIWNPLIPSDFIGRDTLREDIDAHVAKLGTTHANTRELIFLNTWTKHVLSAQTERNPDYIRNRNIRYLDGSSFSMSAWIAVIKDRVSMATVDKDEAWGVVISSTSLASTLKAIFEIQWIKANKIDLDFVKSLGTDDLYRAAQRKKIEL